MALPCTVLMRRSSIVRSWKFPPHQGLDRKQLGYDGRLYAAGLWLCHAPRRRRRCGVRGVLVIGGLPQWGCVRDRHPHGGAIPAAWAGNSHGGTTVEYALSSGFSTIGWQCSEDNLGSIGTAEKVGFERERD